MASLDPAYLNRPARIVNQDGGRILYARTGESWEAGVGAGPPSQVIEEDGDWLIMLTDNGYRIVTAHGHRVLDD